MNSSKNRLRFVSVLMTIMMMTSTFFVSVGYAEDTSNDGGAPAQSEETQPAKEEPAEEKSSVPEESQKAKEQEDVSNGILTTSNNLLDDIGVDKGELKTGIIDKVQYKSYLVDIRKDDPRFSQITKNIDSETVSMKVTELTNDKIPDDFIKEKSDGKLNDTNIIVLSSDLEKIGKDAFKGLYDLNMVVVSRSDIKIEEGAFNGCQNLKCVRVDSKFDINAKPNSNSSSQTEIIDSNIKLYKDAFSGCAKDDKLTIYCEDNIWPGKEDIKSDAFNKTDYEISISKFAYAIYDGNKTTDTRYQNKVTVRDLGEIEKLKKTEKKDTKDTTTEQNTLVSGNEQDTDVFTKKQPITCYGHPSRILSYIKYYKEISRDDEEYSQITANLPADQKTVKLKIAEITTEDNNTSIPDNFVAKAKFGKGNLDDVDVLIIKRYCRYIGKNAFKGLNNLKMVAFRNASVSIEDGAFEGCSKLQCARIDYNFGMEYKEPASIQADVKIGERAFAGCANGRKLTIWCQDDIWPPKKTVATDAFEGTKHEISISQKVHDEYDASDKIDTRYNENIVIREDKEKKEPGTRYGTIICSNTSSPYIRYKSYDKEITKDDPDFSLILDPKSQESRKMKVTELYSDSIPRNFYEKLVKEKLANTELLIIDGGESRKTTINPNAFKGFNRLQMVVFRNKDTKNLTIIEEGAFSDCSNLKCVKVVESLKIGKNAFENCAKDSKLLIYLDGDFWPLKDYIAEGCFNGTDYEMSISGKAFDTYVSNKRLKTCYKKHLKVRDPLNGLIFDESWDGPVYYKSYFKKVTEDDCKWPLITDSNPLTTKTVGLKVTQLTNEADGLDIIPETLQAVAEKQKIDILKDTDILIIDDDFASIGKNAFKGLENLKMVVIKNPMTTIEEGAFQDCKNLFYVNVGGKFNSIAEMKAFNKKWEKETQQSNVKLRKNAFANCGTNAAETNKLFYFDCGAYIWPAAADIDDKAFSGSNYLVGISQYCKDDLYGGFSANLTRYKNNIDYKTWGVDVPGDARISSEVSVPGSHDSATYKTKKYGWTQDLSLKDQWNRGVRFFDFRVVHYDKEDRSKMKIKHGDYNCYDDDKNVLTFHNGIKEIADQVYKSGDFAIIMISHQKFGAVGQHGDECMDPDKGTKEDPDAGLKDWWKGGREIQAELAKWTKDDGDYRNVAALPSNHCVSNREFANPYLKVKDLRGKILFIHNEDGGCTLPYDYIDGGKQPCGIYTGTISRKLGVQTTITDPVRKIGVEPFILQNVYNTSSYNKIKAVEKCFEEYGKCLDKLCFNFTSAYDGVIPKYGDVASDVNKKVAQMVDNLDHSTGILIMDFAGVYEAEVNKVASYEVRGDLLLSSVIRNNFK